MKLVIISDTHMHRIDPPAGDLLIHCGDLTYNGTLDQLELVAEEFARIASRYTHGILYIAGNHDWLFQDDPVVAEALLPDATYLADSGIEIDGVKFWGSPWTPTFMDWAFMADDDDLKRKWDCIPSEVDVLVTHGPPYGIRDLTDRRERAGSQTLRRVVEVRAPALHCFGHIHEGYGQEWVGPTHYINASICNSAYQNINAAFDVELAVE